MFDTTLPNENFVELPPVDDLDSAWRFLQSRINYETRMQDRSVKDELKLNRIADLLRHFGSPERRIPVVHVAGTKGKGSTSGMIARVLTASGLKTGLYTSPHLYNFTERIRVDDVEIGEAEVLRSLNELIQGLRQLERLDSSLSAATFFELLTMMAWLHFTSSKVDIAVLEVGLGGRLDCTNICCPKVCVITPIDYDHQKILGDDLGSIAREKAGIIKPGVPVISAPQAEEAASVIRKVANEQNSPLLRMGHEIPWSGDAREARFSLDLENVPYRDLRGPRNGCHQLQNAALSIAAAHFALRPNSLPYELASCVLDGFQLPLRCEMVSDDPPIIVDAAHTPISIQAMLDFAAHHEAIENPLLVFGCSQDKNVEDLASRLDPHFSSMVLTQATSNPRATNLRTLRRRITPKFKGMIHESETVQGAYELALSIVEETSHDSVVIAGSFFLAAELRQIIERAKSMKLKR